MDRIRKVGDPNDDAMLREDVPLGQQRVVIDDMLFRVPNSEDYRVGTLCTLAFGQDPIEKGAYTCVVVDETASPNLVRVGFSPSSREAYRLFTGPQERYRTAPSPSHDEVMGAMAKAKVAMWDGEYTRTYPPTG